jgi:hypothetical protein
LPAELFLWYNRENDMRVFGICRQRLPLYQIPAVSFDDYDDDRDRDIVITIEYKPIYITEAGEMFTEVRLYRYEPDRRTPNGWKNSGG